MKRLFIIIAAMFAAAVTFGQTPLPNDPVVKVGKLENGMTYYIRHNDKPAQRAEFYLATNVGAYQEADDGQGHADDRFAEHGGNGRRAGREADVLHKRRFKRGGEVRAFKNLHERALGHLRHGEQGQVKALNPAARVRVVKQRIHQRLVALQPAGQFAACRKRQHRRADERSHAQHPADEAAVQAEHDAYAQYGEDDDVKNVHGLTFL